VCLDELATDIPRRASPASSGWFIESMYDFERVRMSALELVELVAKQDVGFGNVGIEQSESRSVLPGH